MNAGNTIIGRSLVPSYIASISRPHYFFSSASFGGSSFHTTQATAIAPLIPAANQIAVGIPLLVLLNHPPIIPPSNIATTLNTRLFLCQFSLNPANNLGSFPKSQKQLVNTVVGISLNPNCLAVTLCMPAWKLSIGSGTSVIQGSFSAPSPPNSMPGTTALCTNAAAVRRRAHCKLKERARGMW